MAERLKHDCGVAIGKCRYEKTLAKLKDKTLKCRECDKIWMKVVKEVT